MTKEKKKSKKEKISEKNTRKVKVYKMSVLFKKLLSVKTAALHLMMTLLIIVKKRHHCSSIRLEKNEKFDYALY